MNQSKYAHSRIDILGQNGNDGVHYEHPYDVYDKEPLPETNKESDLTWLARNVHQWPKKEQGRFVLASKYYGQYGEGIVDCKSGTTKHQWLAERARLQNKPNWDYAPDWANYLAQDANGAWVFYEYEPRTHQDGYWFLHDKLKQVSESGKVLGDWRNTLEKRPEPLEIPDGASCKELEYENYAALKYSDEPVMIPAASVLKQERYKDHNGEDWIDECARTFTTEEFRGAMKFNIGKYNRRAGKKDALIKEITKIEDYARRWRLYEEAKEMD